MLTRFEIKRHTSELLALAVPVVISRLGVVLLSIVDVAMVGHYSTEALAYLGAGVSTLVVTIVAMLVGIHIGTMIAVTNALGNNRKQDCGKAWQRGLFFGLITGIIALIPCLFGEEFLLAMGQSADVAREGGDVIFILGLGLPAYSLTAASTYFLEGIKRPGLATIATILVNIVNLVLNWVLVFGHFGFPELGEEGSAWATTIGRFLWGAGLIAFILYAPMFREYGVRKPFHIEWAKWRDQRHMGIATSLAIGAEVIAFVALQIFAGWIGKAEIALFTICNQILSSYFMVAVGIGTATSIRTGIAHGQGDRREVAHAGWHGFALVSVFAALFALVVIIAPAPILGLFTSDPALIAMGVPLLILATGFMIFDAQQTVASNMLRAVGDSWGPTVIQTVSFLALMLPLGWYLTFQMPWDGKAGLGLHGLYICCYAGLGVSALLQALRFWKKTRI